MDITVSISINNDHKYDSVSSSNCTAEELAYLKELIMKLKHRARTLQTVKIDSLTMKRIYLYKKPLSEYPSYKETKDALKESRYTPITVCSNDVIDGVFRVLIAKELGITEIKAYVI